MCAQRERRERRAEKRGKLSEGGKGKKKHEVSLQGRYYETRCSACLSSAHVTKHRKENKFRRCVSVELRRKTEQRNKKHKKQTLEEGGGHRCKTESSHKVMQSGWEDTKQRHTQSKSSISLLMALYFVHTTLS